MALFPKSQYLVLQNLCMSKNPLTLPLAIAT